MLKLYPIPPELEGIKKAYGCLISTLCWALHRELCGIACRGLSYIMMNACAATERSWRFFYRNETLAANRQSLYDAF